MDFKSLLRATTCTVVFFGGLVNTTAWAQSQDASQIAGQPADTGEDIIVTARLRSERLQDVPVVATTFGAAAIAKYNTLSINQIAVRTPGLVVSDSTNPVGGAIAIRGIGSPTSGPFIDQGVSINLDGVQVSQANILRLGLYDISQVEVLKGPQTLFFGKNSPGGIISIVSANPTDRLEGKFRVGYETEARNKFVEAMISTPITPTLGVRVDGYFSDQRGWFRNIAEPIPSVTLPNGVITAANTPAAPYAMATKTYFGRGTLAYRSESGVVDATLKVAYGEQNSPNGISAVGQLSYCPTGRSQAAAAVGRTFTECKLDRYYAEGNISARAAALDPLLGDGRARSDSRQFLTSLTMDLHPADVIKVTSVTGYLNMRAGPTTGNYDFTGASTLSLYTDIRIKQFTQELRALTSFSSPFNVMMGAYYQDAETNMIASVPLDPPLSSAFTGGVFTGSAILAAGDFTQKTKAYSFYGQGIIDFTSQLQMTAGARYSHELKRVAVIALPSSSKSTSYPITYNPDNASFNDFSPDVTLRYKPRQNITVYAAYREGFLSGGFDLNATSIGGGVTTRGDVSYRQQRVRGGEIGAKGSLFDRQLTFDLAAFYYKYTDLQVSAFDANVLGFRLTNAGSAISKGGEVNLQFRPRSLPGFSANANLAFTPAKYGEFRNAPCFTGQSQAQGCNMRAARDASGNLVVAPVAPNQTANAQDLSGRPLVRNIEWSGTAGVAYDHLLPSGMTFSISGDASYTSSYYAGPTLEEASKQPAAWRFDARVALKGRDDRWELALLGTNLTNVVRATHAFQAAGTGGRTGTTTAFAADEISTPGQPRMITVQATFRY